MLNNREHAEHLLTAIDRMRENGRPVTSREKGYWLDLLEYRDDETGRCYPGRRELKAKTGHEHRALAKMDARAEELRIYVIEQFHDERGRLRNRFIWNPYMLDFDNDGQPTRVLAKSRPIPEKVEQDAVAPANADDYPGEPDRGQVTTESSSIHRRRHRSTFLKEKNGPVLRGQLTTVPGAGDPGESAVASGEGGATPSAPGGRDTARELQLLVQIGELTKQSQALPVSAVLDRYNLSKQIDSRQRELDELRGRPLPVRRSRRGRPRTREPQG